MSTHIITILMALLAGLSPVGCSSASGRMPDTGDEPETPPPHSPVATTPAGRTGDCDHACLTARLQRLVHGAPETVRLEAIARSHEGREVWALTLARPADRPPEVRTAILVVAGLDATHLAGTETAVGIAETLSRSVGLAASNENEAIADGEQGQTSSTSAPSLSVDELLTRHTLYILPRINPDGAEPFCGPTRRAYDGNTRPTDDDRDGVADDDPPEDLNGDGLITQMRVRDPLEATHIADPDEPRLLREADRSKDERPVFRVLTEGIDNDGDGEYNEDAVGGTLPNSNFPHAYAELANGAGPHQLSEPETRALAEFVLSHPNIAAVIVYGRHDNIVKIGDGKTRDVSGRGYLNLHPDDVPMYEHVSERFKEITGLEEASETEVAGSFHGWTYNQRGLPTFATGLWGPPESDEAAGKNATSTTLPTTQPTTQPARHPSTGPATGPDPQANEHAKAGEASADVATTGPATTEPTADSPSASSSTKAEKNAKKKGKKKDPLEVDRKWLAYCDAECDGAGFVSWTPFEHPTLGPVEIGGFVPGLRINPPTEETGAIVDAQCAFVRDIAGRLPRPRVSGCKGVRRSEGVYELELSMTNDAYFPTAMAMAKMARMAYPFVLRPDLPPERVLGGRRVARIPSIGGLGAVEKVRWLIRGEAGEEVGVRIHHERFGPIDTVIRLEESAADPVETGARDD